MRTSLLFLHLLWALLSISLAQENTPDHTIGQVRPTEAHSQIVAGGSGLGKAGNALNKTRILATQVPQYLTEGKVTYHRGGLSSSALSKNLFQYTLMIGGIGAGTSILKDYSKTGELRLDRALDFLTNDEFLKSSMGIFVGSTLLSMAGSFLPPGIPLILKTFPGFLGASLGFEWSQNNLQSVNLTKAVLGSLASAAAFVALGSGGIIAIGGGILASMASDAFFDTFLAKPSLEIPNPPERLFEAPLSDDSSTSSPDRSRSDESKRILERTLFRQMEKAASENNHIKFKHLENQVR